MQTPYSIDFIQRDERTILPFQMQEKKKSPNWKCLPFPRNSLQILPSVSNGFININGVILFFFLNTFTNTFLAPMDTSLTLYS